jgi:hypothetical protein
MNILVAHLGRAALEYQPMRRIQGKEIRTPGANQSLWPSEAPRLELDLALVVEVL